MKKRIFINKPDIQQRGQYTFLDDDITEYSASNSVLQPVDKFSKRDLYTLVKEDNINDTIVTHGLSYPGFSFVKIDRLIINNTGTGKRQKNCNFVGWIFDNYAYGTPGDGSDDPTEDDYTSFFSKLPTTAGAGGFRGPSRFFEWHVGNLGRGGSPETAIEKTNIIENLNSVDPTEPEWKRGFVDFKAEDSFGAPDTVGDQSTIFKHLQAQTIYIAIWCQGDDRRGKSFWKYTDHRRKRLHIFSIKADDLFHDNGLGKETSFSFQYHDAIKREEPRGGGGAEVPAFMVSNLDITINTIPSSFSNLSSDISQITGSILSPKPLVLNEFDTSFLTQHPYNAIVNLQYDDTGNQYYDGEIAQEVRYNFDPVTKIKLSDSHYDFQSYQTSSIDRQICSSPGEVSIDFDISLRHTISGEELNNDAYYPRALGYKFYVIDWNDEENKFREMEDYLNDIPEDFFDLLNKREDNLYNFSDVGIPLKGTYSTPGIKTIKSIIFSHTLEGLVQIVRWKFITSRIFLDIPISQYPDFGEVGGADYTTIPWPYTTPIIGGVSTDSRYKISIADTLSGGKINNSDIINERFLVEDIDNDEQGQSIKQLDLEQVRYFVTGSYDMNTFLGITDKVVNPDILLAASEIASDTYEGDLSTLPFPQYKEEFLISDTEEIDIQDIASWNNVGRTDISTAISDIIFGNVPIPDSNPDESHHPSHFFIVPFNSHANVDYWNCSDWDEERNQCFSEETSVGEIFINDNLNLDLKKDCKLELNTGDLEGKSLLDSSGNGNKGILIGDYRIKKIRKGQPMRRDSYIRLPKKVGKLNGAL